MMKRIPFDSLYHASHGWLESYFHFSFAEYHDSKRMHYGTLRVMNDDKIKPHTGFGTHPHKDMEIITYVLKGELTHEDSMGHKESLGRGAMQYLSAGTGIKHSEKNEGDEVVHLIQIWILPKEKNKTPQYGSKTYADEERHNKWLHLVSGDEIENVVTIYQDANIYVSEIASGETLSFHVAEARQAYLKVMEGEIVVSGVTLLQGDGLEVMNEEMLLDAQTDAHVMLIEMSKR